MTNDQFVGHAPDITGLTVTAHYSDSTLDHAVDSTDLTVTPVEYDEAGAQTLTISYTDEYGTASTTQSVTVLAVVLETLTASGSLTNAQIVGTTPDLTGLTFTAGYSDGSSTTVSSTAITVSPATYPANGNPDNLKEVDLTLSYTDGEVTATTGVDNVVTHRPNEGTLTVGTAGHVYFDMPSAWYNNVKTMQEIASTGASIGDKVQVFMKAADWESVSHTTVSLSDVFTAGMAVGIVTSASGTVNTSGYVPHIGIDFGGSSLADYYVAWSIASGEYTLASDEDWVIVTGDLISAIAANDGNPEWSNSNFDLSTCTVYTVHLLANT